MQLQAMEVPLGKKNTIQNIPKIVLVLILTLIPLYYTLLTQFLSDGSFPSSLLSLSLLSSLSLSPSSSPPPLLPPRRPQGPQPPVPSSPSLTSLSSKPSSSTPPLSQSPLPPPSSSSPSVTLSQPSSTPPSPSSSPPSISSLDDVSNSTTSIRSDENCDIFKGKWVRNPDAPYYTNVSCWFIPDQQNCMKYGRPDTDFMKWRWKPDGCELPIFDPAHFLELVRGKSMAFVGDSVGRNQMQSLICLLSRVDHPTDISNTGDDRFKRWLYTNYNFTIASLWSPFLVRSKEAGPSVNLPTVQMNLYLDEFDEKWTSQMDQFDYLIFSAGQWFFRPAIFYEGGRIVGCNACQHENITDLTMYYGYRKAFQTAFRAVNSHNGFKGMTFLRTFSPAHYENGMWNQGGECVRTRPYMSNETEIEWLVMELHKTQVEEFKAAKEQGIRKRGLQFRLLNTTETMWMRPDGHPNCYGHSRHVSAHNDCVHWCLPGPIDVWNDFLLHMMKMNTGKLI